MLFPNKDNMSSNAAVHSEKEVRCATCAKPCGYWIGTSAFCDEHIAPALEKALTEVRKQSAKPAPEMLNYSVSFMLEVCGYDLEGFDGCNEDDEQYEGDWQEDQFELYGDEDDEEKAKKEALRKKYEERLVLLRNVFKMSQKVLLDVDETWCDLRYAMHFAVEEGKPYMSVDEKDVPVKNINVKFNSVNDLKLKLKGTLTWSSVKADLKSIQNHLDVMFHDMSMHRTFDTEEKWAVDFIGGRVQIV